MPLSTFVWVCRQALFHPIVESKSAYGLYILSPEKGSGPENRYIGETLNAARPMMTISRKTASILNCLYLSLTKIFKLCVVL